MAERTLARVAVSSVPYAADKLYTYRVPDGLLSAAAPGKRVLIPFGRGNKRGEGCVLDVVREEAAEDIEKMAAITPTDRPYSRTGVGEIFRKRIPWLLLLMISATFTGAIISHYEEALGAYVVLTSFIPMLMDTGGNAGGQASVTVIRGLSLGEIVPRRDALSILLKEVRVALLCGSVLAIVAAAKVLLVDRAGTVVAAVVALTLFFSVLTAKSVGSMLPLLARRLGLDPAVMASPFITTIVDAVSLMIYFRIATALLGI